MEALKTETDPQRRDKLIEYITDSDRFIDNHLKKIDVLKKSKEI